MTVVPPVVDHPAVPEAVRGRDGIAADGLDGAEYEGAAIGDDWIGAIGRDWTELRAGIGSSDVSGLMLPVRIGSACRWGFEGPDEKGFEKDALAKRSVEQAAVMPPTTPMIAKREAARINSPPSLLRIARPKIRKTDRPY